ncbi:DUF1129 family protein [Macrococcus animalis]|uniref:DUF1129 family protein n=1 Tax=Macrococcus animalis TaxID=3395467 RepID=UPI0039BE4B30
MSKLNEMDVVYQRKLKQLIPSNKEQFLKVRNALKMDFKLQEREVDSLLSDILDHLIEAQNNGVSTQEFFGNDTKQFTQDLFDELPKNKLIHPLWYILFTISLTTASFLIPFGLLSQIKYAITGSYVPINSNLSLLSLLVFIVLLTTAIFVTIHLMKTNTYSSKKGKTMTLPFYFAMIFLPLVIYFFGYNKNLSEPPGYIIFIIGIPFLIICIITYKKKLSY